MTRITDRAALELYRQEHNRCLGLVVRQLRESRRISQGELARRASCSIRWVKRLEENRMNTNYLLRRVDQVASALSTDLSQLFERAGEMAGPPPWIRAKEGQTDETT